VLPECFNNSNIPFPCKYYRPRERKQHLEQERHDNDQGCLAPSDPERNAGPEGPDLGAHRLHTGLIEAGALEKKGAWYIVHGMNGLPEHVLAQVVTTQMQNKTGQKSVIMVKFRRGVKST
jgi:hypothetical protein